LVLVHPCQKLLSVGAGKYLLLFTIITQVMSKQTESIIH
jgi:hypothetical protein